MPESKDPEDVERLMPPQSIFSTVFPKDSRLNDCRLNYNYEPL